MENKAELWSIGHSTRAIEEFIGAVESFEIKVIADVRSFPGSRRYPQFNKENLKASLAAAGSSTSIFPNSAAVAARDRIHLMWPGATNHFAGMPITWKPTIFVRAWPDSSLWPIHTAPRSCVPKRSGGAVTAV